MWMGEPRAAAGGKILRHLPEAATRFLGHDCVRSLLTTRSAGHGAVEPQIHHLVDGRGLPLVVLVGPGQAGDAPMFHTHETSPRCSTRPGQATYPTGPRPRRQGLLIPRDPHPPPLTRDRRGNPRTLRPARPPHPSRIPRGPPGQLRRKRLQEPQCHGRRLQRRQTVARTRDPLRQARTHLPRRRSPESTIGLFKNEAIRDGSPSRTGPLRTIDDVGWVTAG